MSESSSLGIDHQFAQPYQLTCTNPACERHGRLAVGARCPQCGLRNHLVLPPDQAPPVIAGRAPLAGHAVPSMPSPPGKAVSAADMFSRVVFGGFWALVTFGLTIAGLTGLASGKPGALLAIPMAALTALYSRYIFRGGRVRFLFW